MSSSTGIELGENSVAAIFDGQGTQWEGMGKDVHKRYKVARDVFKIASEACGVDMRRACFGNNPYLLDDTRIAQPAIVTVGLAKYRAWLESNSEPAVVTGLSMGLYPAVGVSAITGRNGRRDTKSVDFETVNTVFERAKIMQAVAVDKNGRMVPVIGPHREDIESAIKGTGAKIGVFLDKTVHTLTGQEHAVEIAATKVSGLKARILDALPIHQAAHHELQADTVEPLMDLLEKSSIRNPIIRIAANGPFYLTSRQEIIEHLLQQMTEPADWQAAEEMLLLGGIRKVVQFGADRRQSLAFQMAKNGKDLGVQVITFPETA